MIEVLAGLCRWLTLISGLALPGLCGWCALGQPVYAPRLPRTLAALGLSSLLLFLATEAALASGAWQDLHSPSAWWRYVQLTHAGFWLGLHVCVQFLTLLVLMKTPPSRRAAGCGALLALVGLGCLAPAGHAAAGGEALGGLLEAVHLLVAGLWFGGLLGVCLYLRGEALTTRERAIKALSGFSRFALPAMLLVLASGLLLALRLVAPRYATLVATPWGAWLMVKLAFLAGILALAARLRFVWLPRLSATLTSSGYALVLGHVRLEFLLAIALLGAASFLGLSVPGTHALIPHWPWPFRWSLVATWPEPGIASQLAAGSALLVLGLLGQWHPAVRRAGVFAIVGGSALVLWTLAVPASEDSFRASSVPFDVISIAHGERLFNAHCTDCHGLQGKGDGKLAGLLPRHPVDLLTEPHTARHTAGDFYHWLGFGIPDTGMPAFSAVLDEEARWDVVNFLHALNRGFESRILRPASVPLQPQPRLAAPAFSFQTRDGESGSLRGLRGKSAVVLVLFSLPGSSERLQALSRLDWNALGARLIVVAQDGQRADLPFEVTDNAAEIAASYQLFRRSLGNPDLFGAGHAPPHMELLIDRFGYLRARWIPSEDEPGWQDLQQIESELRRLAQEPAILPPPDEHVH